MLSGQFLKGSTVCDLFVQLIDLVLCRRGICLVLLHAHQDVGCIDPSARRPFFKDLDDVVAQWRTDNAGDFADWSFVCSGLHGIESRRHDGCDKPNVPSA